MSGKILISVEGQTEETFVRDVLAPLYAPRGLYLQEVVLKTRRVPNRSHFKGGAVSYGKIRNQVLALLRDTSAQAVTTMYDYYALPPGTPGRDTRPPGSGVDRARHVEREFDRDINDRRFHPFLQVHEFEAYLFVDPARTGQSLLGSASQIRRLQDVRYRFATPEDINDNANTSPSHRILDIFPQYSKVVEGPPIISKIGLDAIIETCPHFAAWIAWLDSLTKD